MLEEKEDEADKRSPVSPVLTRRDRLRVWRLRCDNDEEERIHEEPAHHIAH